MTMSWKEIEAVGGFEGAEHFANNTVDPLLRANTAPGTSVKTKEAMSALQLPMILAMLFTTLGMSVILGAFSTDWIRVPVAIVALPMLFFGSIFFIMRFFKDRLVKLIVTGQANFVLRSTGMNAIADFLGLTYVPSPGGAPSGVVALSKFLGRPPALEDFLKTLEDNGGLEKAIGIGQRSGLMLSNTIILARKETREKIVRQQTEMQNLQDGFHGMRAGVEFEAFEWVEPVSEDDDIHHLMLVLPAPMRLQSITELRSRKTSWPNSGVDHPFNEVDLGARDFKDKFKLRATDQTEARAVFNPAVMERIIALAEGDDIRAVAFPEGLVVDVSGKDRFALTHMMTGEWSPESIKTTFSDIAELLSLVEAAAHTFMVPKDRR